MKEALHKISPLGLGFWQAWWVIALCTQLVVPFSGNTSSNASLGFELSTVVLAVTALGYLVVVLISKRFAPLAQRRGVHGAAALLGCAGSLGMSVVAWFNLATPLFLAFYVSALVLFALGNALLLMLWGELWSTLVSSTVGRHLYVSYLFAFAIFFLVAALPQLVAQAITALLPLFSVVMLSFAEGLPRRVVPKLPANAQKLPWVRILSAVALLNVIWGLFQGALRLLPAAENMTQNALILACVLLALLVAWLMIHRPEAEPLALYKPVIPALTAGMVLVVIAPPEWVFVGEGAAIFGGYSLDILIMLVACDFAHKRHLPVALSFGLALFVSRAGSFVGSMLVQLLPYELACELRVLILLALLAVVCIGVLLFSQLDLRELYRATPPAVRLDITIEEKCGLVTEQYHLSSREAEVLVLLAHGRSGPYIGNELFIAHGTVKRHVSNIYRKIGVYDRQSLHDIVANAHAEAENNSPSL